MAKLRRTMMFMPASNPGMLRDAGIYGADTIMFDLEDSVSIREKDSARMLLFQALQVMDYGDTEVLVRINDLEAGGKDDIYAVVRAGVNGVRLPKTTCAQDVLDAEIIIEAAEKACGREVGSTTIFAAIEDPMGVLNAYAIATASKRLIGIAIGGEDYVTSMKTRRFPERNGEELFFARSMIVHAARASGIAAVDTVFSDVNDMDTLRKETELVKQLGFDGKSVINPRQIAVVNEVYTPTEKEISNAKDVLQAIAEAESKGSGVIALNGKMIDKPIVDRAERVIALAKAAGVYEEVAKDEK